MPRIIRSALISVLILVTFFIQPAFAFLGSPQPPSFIQLQATGVINLTTEMSYDPVGNLKTLKDPKGNSTSFEYDSHNNVITATSTAPFNYITRYKYDANSNLIQLERQTGESANPWQSTYYTYDSMDRLETVKDNAGNTTVYTYDPNGNRASVTDALYNRTTYEYDRRDMLSLVYDARGNINAQYTYDENANLKEIKDANNNTTAYTYDGFDRLTKTTYADGSSEEYTYDANSNLIAKKDAKSQTIDYAYNALNRLTLKSLRGSEATEAISYAYDLGSRLKEITDTNGKIAYAYDAADRITQVTYPGSKTVAYAYDANSNRTKLIYPDASHITYDYDALNRLTAIKDQAGVNVATYQYDALSRRTGMSYANNTGATYEYDVINRLPKIKGLSPQGTVPDFSYTYDKIGNRLSMVAASGTHNYNYDFLYQLKKADYPAGYFTQDQTFAYDYLGNRTSTTDGNTTNYSSNNLNQYTNVGTNSYTYDATGNLTSDGTFTYAYDYENRLITANKTGTSAAYKYDSFGRRTEKTVGSATTKFLYDGDQLICEYDNSGNLTTKYIFGPGIDEPILMTKGGQTYYYHYDGLGSVTSLTDSSGSTIESYSYDAFGKPNAASSIGNRYMFTGREYDAETNLFFYRARYYSPELGRFLQRDPVGYWDSMNLYQYVGNNSINFIDPYGYVRWRDLGKSAWGMSINALGIAAGAGVAAIPEPTLSTKIIGVIVLGKSVYGFVANLQNAIDAIVDKKKDKQIVPSSLPNAIAELAAPGNTIAQKISDAVDIATDIGFMKSIAKAVEMAPGLYRTTNGVILELVSFSNPTEFGNIAKIFTVLDYLRICGENAGSLLNPLSKYR